MAVFHPYGGCNRSLVNGERDNRRRNYFVPFGRYPSVRTGRSLEIALAMLFIVVEAVTT